MRSVVAYLLFCFYTVIALFDNLVGSGQGQTAAPSLMRPTLFLSVSFYFLVAGLVGFLLAWFQVRLQQNIWLSAVVIISYIANYAAWQYFLLRKNRGLLLLENFAPLVKTNKWLYPATALLFFAVSLVIFVAGARFAFI